jgi:protein TonB
MFQPVDVACPVQVQPEMPIRATRDGIEGVVKVRFVVRDGRVVDVTFVSVPVRGVFESAVRAALARYRCQSLPGQDVLTEQDFTFKFTQ